MNETNIWNKILAVVLKMPGVKVDRIGFLRKELRPYCNQARLQMLGSVRPYTIVSEEVIDKLARQCIRRHTALATATSTVAGLPGGLALAATLPADLTQYFYHIFVVSQKLAYLYGYPDLCDEEGQLTSEATDMLTIFIGVMMKAPVADKGITELTKAVAENAVTRLPRVALTKTAVFPIAAQLAKIIGSKLSKDGFTKGIGKFIPIAGGLFAGGLTFYTFRPGANRLRKQLRAQRHLFHDDYDISGVTYDDIRASFVKSAEAERSPEALETAIIEAMINMAKINDDVTPEKYHLIEQRIARAAIDNEEKLKLLGAIDTEQSFNVDFDLLSADRDAAKDAIDAMQQVAGVTGKMTTAEKIFLQMASRRLGVEV